MSRRSLSPRTLSFTSIYGNGWFSMPTGERRKVAQPFRAELPTAAARHGLIVTKDHEFQGCVASFSPRHQEPSDKVHVEISRDGTPLAIGYARIAVDN